MKKFIILISVIVSVNALSMMLNACNPCKNQATTYRTESILGKAVQITGLDTVNASYKNYFVQNYEGQSVRYDSIAFVVLPSVRVISSNVNYRPTLIAGAYACSPAENYDLVYGIQVTSDANYNKAFPAGADLKEIMSVSSGKAVNANSLNSSASRVVFGEDFFKIISAPSTNQLHNITFTYQISENRTLQTTIKNIYITK